MHWKLKSMIQRSVALLPSKMSYQVYYLIQRNMGGLRVHNPRSRLTAAVNICKQIIAQGQDPLDKIFFEVGTGRVPNIAIAYWLIGAKKTITLDINPYLKEELLRESLNYMQKHTEDIQNIFGPLLIKERFFKLMCLVKENHQMNVSDVFDLCKIEYLAPGDASCTYQPSESVDYHTSYTVFEHIPLKVLESILKEGNRIIRKNGLFIHTIDYSDHFSHSDHRISAINFLQYSDEKWAKLSGNRYMYMNRLRHDDFVRLFESSKQEVLDVKCHPYNKRVNKLLRNNSIQLDKKFKSKSEDTLKILGASFVLSKKE